MRLLSTLLFCLAGLSAQGQFFSLQPDSLLEAQAETDIHNLFQIDILNETGGSLALSWRRVESNYPEGWEVELCDNQYCYGLIPPSGDMWPIGQGGSGYLRLDIFPNGQPGLGVFRFRVYPTGAPDSYRLVSFIVQAGLTSSGEPALVALRFGPNPCGELARLFNPWPQTLNLQLFNSAGQLTREFSVPPSAEAQLGLAALPPGAYWLAGAAQGRIIFREKIIKQ